MSQVNENGSWLDVAASTTRVMDSLEPMIEEAFERLVQGTLDRQSVAWTNMQVLIHRDYLEQHQRREHQVQRRFISDQPGPDPTIPSGGAVNDLRVGLNEMNGALYQAIKKLEAIDKRHDRIDQQFAYLHHKNAWLEYEPDEEEVEDPDD